MAWLSINPRCEEFRYITAAMALNSVPESDSDLFGYVSREIDPITLAGYYNNVEALGIDLFSVRTIPSHQITTVSEDREAILALLLIDHKEFIEEVSKAIALDIYLYNSLDYGYTYDLLITYDPESRTHDA